MEAKALSFVLRAAGSEHHQSSTKRVFTYVVGGRVGMNDTCYFTLDMIMKKLDLYLYLYLSPSPSPSPSLSLALGCSIHIYTYVHILLYYVVIIIVNVLVQEPHTCC